MGQGESRQRPRMTDIIPIKKSALIITQVIEPMNRAGESLEIQV